MTTCGRTTAARSVKTSMKRCSALIQPAKRFKGEGCEAHRAGSVLAVICVLLGIMAVGWCTTHPHGTFAVGDGPGVGDAHITHHIVHHSNRTCVCPPCDSHVRSPVQRCLHTMRYMCVQLHSSIQPSTLSFLPVSLTPTSLCDNLTHTRLQLCATKQSSETCHIYAKDMGTRIHSMQLQATPSEKKCSLLWPYAPSSALHAAFHTPQLVKHQKHELQIHERTSDFWGYSWIARGNAGI